MALQIVLLFVTVAVGLFALITGFYEPAESVIMRQRLAALERAEERAPREDLALLRDELLSAIPALNRVLARSPWVSRLQDFLSQAGVQMLAGRFLLFSACLGMVSGLLTSLRVQVPWLSIFPAVLGAAIPFVYASARRAARFNKIEAKLPEAIDLMVRAIRAGHSLATSLEMIAEEMNEPLASEFRKVFDEQKFGLPMRDALLNLAMRVDTLDVKFLVTALTLQRETGGNLAEILEKLSSLMRERFKLMRQLRVYTAQGRLTMIILMAVPPGWLLVMSFLNPSFVQPLFNQKLGHTMLAGAAILQFVGYLLIRKIIHIRV